MQENLLKNAAFNCSHLKYPQHIPIFAITSNGGWGVCDLEVVVIDTSGQCADDSLLSRICLEKPDGSPVSNVTVYWGGGPSNTTVAIHQQSCIYTRPDTAHMISLLKQDEIKEGLSSYDLLLIRKHILGIITFTHGVQFLAADVNNSGTITVKDLLDIRSVILGIKNFFPGNNPWKFIPKFWLAQNFYWKNEITDNFLRFDPKIFRDRPYEFITIKLGDVSSVTPN